MAYSDPLIVIVILSDRYRGARQGVQGRRKVADWRFVYL